VFLFPFVIARAQLNILKFEWYRELAYYKLTISAPIYYIIRN